MSDMAGFQDIIGQEQICEHLQTALKLQKVSHAYIINGERNSGGSSSVFNSAFCA